jgi:hypothetical protein
MAAAALITAAPVETSPVLPMVANDNAGCWTADPRAAKLLASCVALPPVYAEQRSRYGNSVDRWNAHVGYRVEAIEAIRMEIGDRLMQAYHQHGEDAYAPFRQWCEQPNATDAISAAIASNAEA